jgi:hypothetical protein
VVRRGDTFELRYTVVREGTRTDNWDKLLSSMSWRPPQLVDGDGLALYQTGNRDERQASPDRTFVRWLSRTGNGRPDRGAPQRVVWSVPVESEEIEIPFEFHDLPLPR